MLDEAAAGGAPPRLVEAMRHAPLGGGKRLRPFLLLECAGLFGVPPQAALPAAAALECVHCYSLVHDDLPAMDDDDLRRGKPTVHKAFDEWTAILAGDALLTLAFELLAGPQTHADAAVRAELLAGLARAAGAGGMVGGQCLDLEADKLGLAGAADDAACRAPAGHEDRRADPLCLRGRRHPRPRRAPSSAGRSRVYGERLGAAFQIADDLLDVEGEAAAMGKADPQGRRQGHARLGAGRARRPRRGSAALEARRSPRSSRSARVPTSCARRPRFVVRRQTYDVATATPASCASGVLAPELPCPGGARR